MSAPADAAAALELRLEGRPNIGRGGTRHAIFAVALAFAAFQFWATLANPLSDITLRSVHAAFVVGLGLLVFTVQGRPRAGVVGLGDAALVAATAACGVYFLLEADNFARRVGWPEPGDLLAGAVFTALVLEASRRAAGPALTSLCAAALAWGAFGHLLPSPLDHRGYDLEQLTGALVLGTDGLFGSATAVSATYVFLFLLFSAFMQQSGILALFNDLALRLVGRMPSGPAQACIVSSALTGTVSGSGIANVVASGQVTIPLMRRYGYRPNFAAAVEAASSMGGQIMPPVMGAGAFIMADMLDIPYAQVALGALLPALLYFAGIAWIAYLEARRLGLGPAAVDGSTPVLAGRLELLLPLAVIVLLLWGGYTPLYAANGALAFTVVMILARPLAALGAGRFGDLARAALVAGALGLLATAGLFALVGLAALLAGLNLLHPGGRGVLVRCGHSAYHGAVGAAPVGITCVVIGIVEGVLGLTGVSLELTGAVLGMGGDLLWLSLILVMLACLCLGLGLPTIPAYVICASVAVPALQGLGVGAFEAHMFVFYFSVLAQLTPPIALAAVAAAPFAGPTASPFRIGCIATALGLSGFLVPFALVFAPELIFATGSAIDAALAAGGVLVAVGFCGVAFVGYLRSALSAAERGLLAVAAIAVASMTPAWSVAGLCAGALVFALNLRPRRLGANPRGGGP